LDGMAPILCRMRLKSGQLSILIAFDQRIGDGLQRVAALLAPGWKDVDLVIRVIFGYQRTS